MQPQDIKDPEILAMNLIASSLSPLAFDVRKRIIDWTTKRFADADNKDLDVLATHDQNARPAIQRGTTEPFLSIIRDSAHTTHADRVILAGYWLLKMQAKISFTSKEVKMLLDKEGHPIPNPFEVLLKLEKRSLLTSSQVKLNSAFKHKEYSLTDKGIQKCETELLNKATR